MSLKYYRFGITDPNIWPSKPRVAGSHPAGRAKPRTWVKREKMRNDNATTEESDRVYQVFYESELLLESNEVVKLTEHYDGKDLPPVIYFPFAALSNLKMSRTELTTTCPIKGSASYWSYKEAENGIWSYENPLQDVGRIKAYFGFDQKKGFRIKVKLD